MPTFLSVYGVWSWSQNSIERFWAGSFLGSLNHLRCACDCQRLFLPFDTMMVPTVLARSHRLHVLICQRFAFKNKSSAIVPTQMLECVWGSLTWWGPHLWILEQWLMSTFRHHHPCIWTAIIESIHKYQAMCSTLLYKYDGGEAVTKRAKHEICRTNWKFCVQTITSSEGLCRTYLVL